jgi:hypothetical protein
MRFIIKSKKKNKSKSLIFAVALFLLSLHRLMNNRLINSLFLTNINTQALCNSLLSSEQNDDDDDEDEIEDNTTMTWTAADGVTVTGDSGGAKTSTNSGFDQLLKARNRYRYTTQKKYDRSENRIIIKLQGVLKESKKTTLIVDEVSEYTRKSCMNIR